MTLLRKYQASKMKDVGFSTDVDVIGVNVSSTASFMTGIWAKWNIVPGGLDQSGGSTAYRPWIHNIGIAHERHHFRAGYYYEISFTLVLPPDVETWIEDSAKIGSSDVVFYQQHAVLESSQVDTMRSPAFALHLENRGTPQFAYYIRGDHRLASTPQSITQLWGEFGAGTIQNSSSHDFIIRMIPSTYNSGNPAAEENLVDADGVTEIWHNGDLVTSRQGIRNWLGTHEKDGQGYILPMKGAECSLYSGPTFNPSVPALFTWNDLTVSYGTQTGRVQN